MPDDIASQVLERFERRLENTPEVSPASIHVLLEDQRKNDFGDDEELLEELRITFEDSE